MSLRKGLTSLRKNLDKKMHDNTSSESLSAEVNLLHFELFEVIGQGAFGKVYPHI